MFTPVAASSLEDIEVIRLFRAEVSRRDCVEIFREVGVVESEGEKQLVLTPLIDENDQDVSTYFLG
jgi:hypothetical protein